jgi:hypothetical protein
MLRACELQMARVAGFVSSLLLHVLLLYQHSVRWQIFEIEVVWIFLSLTEWLCTLMQGDLHLQFLSSWYGWRSIHTHNIFFSNELLVAVALEIRSAQTGARHILLLDEHFP